MFKFLNKSTKSISIAAIILAVTNFLSLFLGVVRDSVFANRFGAGDVLDIYNVAFRLPDILFNLLLMGALAAGFIPIFSSYYFKDKEGQKEALLITSGLLNFALLAWLVAGILLMIFAPQAMRVLAPGFSPEKIAQSAHLTRIIIFSPLFLTVSAIFGGVLQSLRRFLVFAFSPVFYNLGIIFGAFFLYPKFGINGLGLGVVIGAFLHMAIQLPAVLMTGWRPRFYLKFHPGIKAIIFLTIPRALSIGVSQVNLIVTTILASILPVGSLTIYNFANNLQAAPVGLIGVSLATAAFPSLSQALIKGDVTQFRSIFRQSTAKIFFFIIPLSFAFFIIREPLVHFIFANKVFGHSQFDATAISLTIQTFSLFVFGIFAQALIPFIARVFYALKDTKTPFFVGLFCALLNLFLGYTFSKTMGVSGLAMGFSISGIINLLILWYFLKSKQSESSPSLDWSEIGKVFVVSCVAGVTAYLMLVQGFARFFPYNYFWQMVVVGCVFTVIFLVFGWAIKIKELYNVLKFLKINE